MLPMFYKFMNDMMFFTLTNANFDPQRFVQYILRANDMKRELIELAGNPAEHVRGADYIAPSVNEATL